MKKLELTISGKMYFKEGKVLYPSSFFSKEEKTKWLLAQSKTALKTARLIAKDVILIKQALDVRGIA